MPYFICMKELQEVVGTHSSTTYWSCRPRGVMKLLRSGTRIIIISLAWECGQGFQFLFLWGRLKAPGAVSP